MLAKIKAAIAGKKTYILGVVGIVTTVVAWASGEVSDTEALVAVFVALQTMFLRAGIAKAN